MHKCTTRNTEPYTKYVSLNNRVYFVALWMGEKERLYGPQASDRNA